MWFPQIAPDAFWMRLQATNTVRHLKTLKWVGVAISRTRQITVRHRIVTFARTWRHLRTWRATSVRTVWINVSHRHRITKVFSQCNLTTRCSTWETKWRRWLVLPWNLGSRTRVAGESLLTPNTLQRKLSNLKLNQSFKFRASLPKERPSRLLIPRAAVLKEPSTLLTLTSMSSW